MTLRFRSVAIAALAVFALAGDATPSFAGITYNVTNYTAGQNGWSLAGTITVSGTGTLTSASDITEWDLTATKLGVSRQYNKSTSLSSFPLGFLGSLDAPGSLHATPTTLSLAAGSFLIMTQNVAGTANIHWANQYEQEEGLMYSAYIAQWDREEDLWIAPDPVFSPIVSGAWTIGTATPSAVPEPSTWVLAVIGAGAVALKTWRRRRSTLVA